MIHALPIWKFKEDACTLSRAQKRHKEFSLSLWRCELFSTRRVRGYIPLLKYLSAELIIQSVSTIEKTVLRSRQKAVQGIEL